MRNNNYTGLNILIRGVLVLLAVFYFSQISFSQSSETSPLPEQPLKGSQVFIEKECIKCHTVRGIGDAFGPDLTLIGREKNFFELAGALWSHSPKMIDVMMEKDIQRPELTSGEISALMAYLYYLGFFDEMGEYFEGERIFSDKGCVRCHSLGGARKKRGPSLDKYSRYVSPVFLSAALWNHSSQISEDMLDQAFAPQEMSHLLAFIRGEGLYTGDTIYMQPGNPKKGGDVFERKSCSVCHGRSGQDLLKSDIRKSLTDILGMMWNHSYQMWQEIREKGLRVPDFDSKEMADLMTFLYFIPYYGDPGDSDRGHRIFEDKGCVSCHSQDAVEKGKGIDLTDVSGLDVFKLISVMWNHVPEMEKMVSEMNLIWPRFEKGEMKDLVLYIRSLKR